jgi:hypothetical protein
MCGEELDDVTEHYWFNGPTGCRQFEDEDRQSGIAYCIRCIVVVVQVISTTLFFILFIPLSLTLVVWFPLFILCFAPCHRFVIHSDAMFAALVCSVLVAYAPIVAFQVVWTLCAIMLWFALRPCGARRTHLLDLVQVPIASVSNVVRCIVVRRMFSSPWVEEEYTVDYSSDEDERSDDDESDVERGLSLANPAEPASRATVEVVQAPRFAPWRWAR